MADDSVYAGREQTLVKHYILRQYLVTWAHKVASFCDTLTYVDPFAGPWKAETDDLSDASFSIALTELRKARGTYEAKNRKLAIRCFFVEKKKSAFKKLKGFGDAVSDAEVKTRNGSFEQQMSEIVAFIKAGGSRNFTFIFIDPTGWTGFAMETIKPLLALERTEVLINFMTSHIRRFVDSPQKLTQESFERMFGSADFRERIQGLHDEEKEDALIGVYMKNLKKLGKFDHVAAAIVLDPLISRTHFHLIYATRHPVGLQVFKAVEKKAMEVMVSAQAEAQHKKRQEEVPQGELFGSRDLYNPLHFEGLRRRYCRKATELVLSLLRKHKRISYELAWRAAISFPLVWESDLKDWIKAWQKDGVVTIEGLIGKQRVPQLDSKHFIQLVAGK